jgi:undecaprenyl-diphosphatase
MSVLEYIVLGAIQGIAEWLPVSSEGLVVLANVSLFGGSGLVDLIRTAIFLHMGTLLAAIVYFRRDVRNLLVGLARYGSAGKEVRGMLRFLVVATTVSGAVGLALLFWLSGLESTVALPGRVLTGGVGALLVVTGVLQLSGTRGGSKGPADSGNGDGAIIGFLQGLAILPGFSRSGLTVAGLLFRRFDKMQALRMSFIMSIPAVLAGNIALNIGGMELSWEALAGLGASFLMGFATIHTMMRIAGKVNFGYFAMGFGALALLSALVLG